MNEYPKILFIYIAPKPDNRSIIVAALDFVETKIQDCFTGVKDFYFQLDKQSLLAEENNCFPQLLKLFGTLRVEKMQFYACEVGQAGMTFLADRPDVKQWLAKRGVNSRVILCNAPTTTNTP